MMKHSIGCLGLVMGHFLLLSGLAAQPRELTTLGQTPGGSGYTVMYDSLSARLFVGCGTSIWVYDATQLDSVRLIAMRGFHGLVNEMILRGSVLFAAATHDGLWALDAESETLRTLAHYPTRGDSAAYDLKLDRDTLYLATGYAGIVLTFDHSAGFTEQARLGRPALLAPNVFTVARRGDIIAAGARGLVGALAFYHTSALDTPVCVWQKPVIGNVHDIRFADRRDDILYVCAGSDNGGFTGRFYAFQILGDSLFPIDSFKKGGIPGYASAAMVNMDSRNDTLFLATTAVPYDTFPPVPVTQVPVLDATGLPDDTMRRIAQICPGLWHFDVELIDRAPRRYAAISSEWLGVLLTEVTNLRPLDTVGFIPTGGWCNGPRPRHDTLWGCMEGYGLAAFDENKLLYSAGFQPDFKHLYLPTVFTTDCTWADDTLFFVAYGGVCGVYNLAPWQRGGSPARLDSFRAPGINGLTRLACTATDRGPRIVSSMTGFTLPGRLELHPAYPDSGYPLLDSVIVRTAPYSFAVCGDTVFVGAVIDSHQVIAAYRVTGDRFVRIAQALTPANQPVLRTAKEGSTVVVACGFWGAVWYRFTGDTFLQLGATPIGGNVQDAELVDGRIYVADKWDGLQVYDIRDSAPAELVGFARATGGWQSGFGCNGVEVGANGRVYLSDFHAGVFIIEPLMSAVKEDLPAARGLALQVSPGMFHSRTAIAFVLPEAGPVELVVYDAAGRKVRKLLAGRQSTGRHSAIWDGRDDQDRQLSPGVYFGVLATGQGNAGAKLVLLP